MGEIKNPLVVERDEARKKLVEARTIARYLRNTLISQSLTEFVDGLLLQPFHDENNQPPEWLTYCFMPDDKEKA